MMKQILKCKEEKRQEVLIEKRKRNQERKEKIRKRIEMRGCEGKGLEDGIERLKKGFKIGEREKEERKI